MRLLLSSPTLRCVDDRYMRELSKIRNWIRFDFNPHNQSRCDVPATGDTTWNSNTLSSINNENTR